MILDKEMMSPSEILHYYPKIAKIWDATKLGCLLWLNLVRGKKLRRGCLLNSTDVLNLFDNTFNRHDPAPAPLITKK